MVNPLHLCILPEALFVPFLHHSSLSSLTPVHLVGQTLRPRGAHTKRNGDVVFFFISSWSVCLSALSLFLLIPYFFFQFFPCRSTPSGKKSWNTCLICLSKPQSDVHFSNKSGEICPLGTTGWGACLFNFKLVYLLAGKKKKKKKELLRANNGSQRCTGVDKGTHTRARTHYWLRDTKKNNPMTWGPAQRHLI